MRGKSGLVQLEENPRAWSLQRCPTFWPVSWHCNLQTRGAVSSADTWGCVHSCPGICAAHWLMDMSGSAILNRVNLTTNFLPRSLYVGELEVSEWALGLDQRWAWSSVVVCCNQQGSTCCLPVLLTALRPWHSGVLHGRLSGITIWYCVGKIICSLG